MKHYVYKITDPITGQYYFGSRSHKDPENDDYMGSMKTWKPEDDSRLVKEIIKDDFKTREEAIEFESKIIEENIDDNLNENYHIPNKGFHTKGMEFTETHRNLLRKNHADISGDKNPFYGKSYSDKTKRLISAKNKKYYQNNRHPYEGIEREFHPMFEKRHSKETINFLRKINTGENNPMYGKRGKLHHFYGKCHSYETRKKMSKNHADVNGDKNPNSKRVMEIKSENIYNTLKEAAEISSVSQVTVINHCKNRVRQPRWKYIK